MANERMHRSKELLALKRDVVLTVESRSPLRKQSATCKALPFRVYYSSAVCVDDLACRPLTERVRSQISDLLRQTWTISPSPQRKVALAVPLGIQLWRMNNAAYVRYFQIKA